MFGRRKKQSKLQENLSKLSDSQETALMEMIDLGFSLDFVRSTDDGQVAIASKQDDLITIDSNGHVEHDPDIHFRR